MGMCILNRSTVLYLIKKSRTNTYTRYVVTARSGCYAAKACASNLASTH